MKNFVPLFLAVNFFHLGCFKDYYIRAIPEVLGVWRLERNATQRCAQADISEKRVFFNAKVLFVPNALNISREIQ